MKKIFKNVSISFLIAVLMAMFSFISNAASYPLIYPNDSNPQIFEDDMARLEFTIFHEYKDEQYHVNIYKGNVTDTRDAELVASFEDTIYATSSTTKFAITWDTTGVESGIYTMEYYMSFYSLYEWHDAPSKKTMTLTVKEKPDPNVTVSIPAFSITINGSISNNANAKYPYIVYNDITYCPMTYHGSRFLGLETNWTKETGLSIVKLGGGSTGNGETSSQIETNTGNYPAVMASGAIKVNGKEINNLSEEYPVLVFRDVTYFPLTWRFAVTEFGWDYSFTKENGLIINSK